MSNEQLPSILVIPSPTMPSLLREWLAPLAESQLRLVLEEFQGYASGTHLQKGNLTCSPDAVTVHLKKKRAIQAIRILDNSTRLSVEVIASDGIRCICATFEQDGITAFQKSTGRKFHSIKGAIVIIDDYHLIFRPDATEPSERMLLNVSSFKLLGSEGSKTMGAPTDVTDANPVQQMFRKLKNLLSGPTESGSEPAASNNELEDHSGSESAAGGEASQLDFITQVMRTQPPGLEISLGADSTILEDTTSKRRRENQNMSLATRHDRVSRSGRLGRSNENPMPPRTSPLASVPIEKSRQATAKLEAKFNERQSQSSNLSPLVKSTNVKSSYISTADQENYVTDLMSPMGSDSAEEDNNQVPERQNLADESGQKSVIAIDAPSQENSHMLFVDSFESINPFEGLKRVPRKYVRIPREQQALLDNSSWFNPLANDHSAMLPGPVRQGLADFLVREAVAEELEEDNDESGQPGQSDSEQYIYAQNGNEDLNQYFEVERDEDEANDSDDELSEPEKDDDYQQIDLMNQNLIGPEGEESEDGRDQDEDGGFDSDFADARLENFLNISSGFGQPGPYSSYIPDLAHDTNDFMPINDRGHFIGSEPSQSTNNQAPTDDSPIGLQTLDLAVPIAMGDFLDEDEEEDDEKEGEEDDGEDGDVDSSLSQNLPSTAINKFPVVQVEQTPYVHSNLQSSPKPSAYHPGRHSHEISSDPVIPATHIDLSSQPIQLSMENGEYTSESLNHEIEMEPIPAEERIRDWHEASQRIADLTTKGLNFKSSANIPEREASRTDQNLPSATQNVRLTSFNNRAIHQKSPSSTISRVVAAPSLTNQNPRRSLQRADSSSTKDEESNEERQRKAEKRKMKEERFWKKTNLPEKDSTSMAEESRDMFFADLLKPKNEQEYSSPVSKSRAGPHHLKRSTAQPSTRMNSTAQLEYQVAATIAPLKQAPSSHQQPLTSGQALPFDEEFYIPSTRGKIEESSINQQTNGMPNFETISNPASPLRSVEIPLLDNHPALSTTSEDSSYRSSNSFRGEPAAPSNDAEPKSILHRDDSQQQQLVDVYSVGQYADGQQEDARPEITDDDSLQQSSFSSTTSFQPNSTAPNDDVLRSRPLEGDDELQQEHFMRDGDLHQEGSGMNFFDKFRFSYPDYPGSQKEFTLALVYMEWLSAEGKTVNTMLCDEFVRFYPEDYNALNGVKMGMSGWELFNKKVKDTDYRKQVITVDNFEDALLSLNPQEVEKMRAIFDRPEQIREHLSRSSSTSISGRPQDSGPRSPNGDGEKVELSESPISKKKTVQRQPFFETPSQILSTKRKEPPTIPDMIHSSAKRSRTLPWSAQKPETPRVPNSQSAVKEHKVSLPQPSPILGDEGFQPRSHQALTRNTTSFGSLSPPPLKDPNRRRTLNTATVIPEKPKPKPKRQSRMSANSTFGSVNVGPRPKIFRSFLERLAKTRPSTPSSTPTGKPSSTKRN